MDKVLLFEKEKYARSLSKLLPLLMVMTGCEWFASSRWWCYVVICFLSFFLWMCQALYLAGVYRRWGWIISYGSVYDGDVGKAMFFVYLFACLGYWSLFRDVANVNRYMSGNLCTGWLHWRISVGGRRSELGLLWSKSNIPAMLKFEGFSC